MRATIGDGGIKCHFKMHSVALSLILTPRPLRADLNNLNECFMT